jgi:hypothetical protein
MKTPTENTPPTIQLSNEPLWDEHQLAFQQNRSVKTVQADRAKGTGVPFIKIGRLVRYRPSLALKFENERLRLSTSGNSLCPKVEESQS